MIFDQANFNIRCEWGRKGVSLLAPISDVIIIVDVLSFSTAVEIATRQGAVVFPYQWKDHSVHDFASSVAAEVADKTNKHGYKLSPASLQSLPSDARLVLPSPNGAELSLATGATPTLAGCLRNARAIAASAMRRGKNIAVIPAGEKWEDGTLRPCVEDLVGAGAIIAQLRGTLSPEAGTALAVFRDAGAELTTLLRECVSGQEKIARGESLDVALAAEINVSSCVPLLQAGAYRKEK
ncbi:MAG: 2-phosphosulfolactate phosphatase [Blastocatellia bacterium]